MHNYLQTFPSNVCVCVISNVGSLDSMQKRDWRGSKRNLKERQGSQLVDTFEKWKNELNSDFGGNYSWDWVSKKEGFQAEEMWEGEERENFLI